MNPEALRKLIDAGETQAVEFKGEERAPLNDRDLVEAVVCLANRSGSDTGWVLIGVEDDGRITRREAAELCRIGPYQATRLLNKLVRDGQLLRHGTKKGRFMSEALRYERAQKRYERAHKYVRLPNGFGELQIPAGSKYAPNPPKDCRRDHQREVKA